MKKLLLAGLPVLIIFMGPPFLVALMLVMTSTAAAECRTQSSQGTVPTELGDLGAIDGPVGGPVNGMITMAQANIPRRSGLDGFRASMPKVLSKNPEFVPLNEASGWSLEQIEAAAPQRIGLGVERSPATPAGPVQRHHLVDRRHGRQQRPGARANRHSDQDNHRKRHHGQDNDQQIDDGDPELVPAQPEEKGRILAADGEGRACDGGDHHRPDNQIQNLRQIGPGIQQQAELGAQIALGFHGVHQPALPHDTEDERKQDGRRQQPHQSPDDGRQRPAPGLPERLGQGLHDVECLHLTLPRGGPDRPDSSTPAGHRPPPAPPPTPASIAR